MKKRRTVILTIIASVLAIIFLVPLIWMFSTSFKTDFEAISGGINFIPKNFTWENYKFILYGEGFSISIFRWIFNSLFSSIVGVIIIVTVDALAAYALARLDVPMKKIILTLFVSSLMVPFVITFLPLYLLFSEVNLLNTFAVLILPYTANAFGVFLLYQFFKEFPDEIEEAARIDGANKWQIFSKIVLPSSKPLLGTVAIFSFMTIYNDFLWPSVAISSPEMRTITTGIATMQQGSLTSSYGKMMAMTTVATVPILVVFILGQKQFVKGVNQTGIK